MENICVECRKSADCKHKPPENRWTVAGCPLFVGSAVITNADRIRSMTDEGLAEWVTTKGRTFGEEYEGYASALDWLKAPVEEVDDANNG